MIKVCPKCKSESLPRYKFCGDCGAILIEMSRGTNLVILMREKIDELEHNMSEAGGFYPIFYERNQRLVRNLEYLIGLLVEESTQKEI